MSYPPVFPEFTKRRFVREMPTNEQPINRLYQVGATFMSTGEILATVLQTDDAVDLANDILNHYGNLSRILHATPEQLAHFKIDAQQVARIKASLELGRRLVIEERQCRGKISSPADIANMLMAEMSTLTQEHLRVALLNTRNEVIDIPTIYIGSLNASVIRIGEVIKPAIIHNAAAFILIHNHPSGDPSPSPEDIQVTRQVKKAAELVDLKLLDHVIIGHNRYVSLQERGLGFD